jgi:hypothetical protein
LVSIDTTVANKLFTAPAYPGDIYLMKVNMFTSTNLLVESMLVNLTTVYGDLLSVPQITFTIPLDASTYGLF